VRETIRQFKQIDLSEQFEQQGACNSGRGQPTLMRDKRSQD
jgi:hypothetical protein